ncbi:MAG: DUF438 domain-containing protein [Calditrichia bacterium]
MSELINNTQKRKELLKHMILQLHEGKTAEAVKKQPIRLLGEIPYGVVVEAEQELIAEGLPAKEVLKLCDVHGEALKGVVDLTGAKKVPPGHPVDTFLKENEALESEILNAELILSESEKLPEGTTLTDQWLRLHQHFNNLMDIDKHYRRKENLLFPFLEKYGITGPPTVMWGKDDEVRELLKNVIDTISSTKSITAGELKTIAELIIKPALKSVDEMIYKEQEILFPMCLDTLTDLEWYEIYQQSDEIGYCLVAPQAKWVPDDLSGQVQKKKDSGLIQFQTGNFHPEELERLFDTLPVDLTFVDKDDTVKFFSNNPNRIFDRNRAIIGRKVQMCHPPSSVHVVQKILDDFKAGKQDRAAFWINLKGRFIHIEYFAMRSTEKQYLGTLEISQDLTDLRKLEGEQRLLNYEGERE